MFVQVKNYPPDNFMFKVDVKTQEQGVKCVQS